MIILDSNNQWPCKSRTSVLPYLWHHLLSIHDRCSLVYSILRSFWITFPGSSNIKASVVLQQNLEIANKFDIPIHGFDCDLYLKLHLTMSSFSDIYHKLSVFPHLARITWWHLYLQWIKTVCDVTNQLSASPLLEPTSQPSCQWASYFVRLAVIISYQHKFHPNRFIYKLGCWPRYE